MGGGEGGEGDREEREGQGSGVIKKIRLLPCYSVWCITEWETQTLIVLDTSVLKKHYFLQKHTLETDLKYCYCWVVGVQQRNLKIA